MFTLHACEIWLTRIAADVIFYIAVSLRDVRAPRRQICASWKEIIKQEHKLMFYQYGVNRQADCKRGALQSTSQVNGAT